MQELAVQEILGTSRSLSVPDAPDAPHNMKKAIKNKAWHDFEKEVAALYKELGAVKVIHDIDVDGNQIDVYVEMPIVGMGYVKTIISCKHYKSAVGVPQVREWNEVFVGLKHSGKVDLAVIVTGQGFSNKANTFAEAKGIKLVTIEGLRLESNDFVPYVKGQLADFEKEDIFARPYYIPMKVRMDGNKIILPVHDAVQTFLSESDSPLLGILGDYGAGKTTFCKKLFIEMAVAFLKHPGKTRMPVFINLRDFPPHSNVPGLITHAVVNKYCGRNRGFAALASLNRKGKLLLIFDGFDEMASRMEFSATLRNFQQLEELFKDEAKVLLTCRTHYFKDQEELRAAYRGTQLYERAKQRHYELVHMQPLEAGDIQKYVRTVCGKTWIGVYKQIQRTYNLIELASRPILLAMITEVLPGLVEQKKQITSANLYQAYTSRWLRRDEWRGKLTLKERWDFTLAFAYEIYNRGDMEFLWSDVERAIWKRFARTPDDEVYEHIIRACTFVRWNPETQHYSFAHESFAEFFVASYLYGLLGVRNIECLKDRVHAPEVLSFLVAFPGTKDILSAIGEGLRENTSAAYVVNALVLLTGWSGGVGDVSLSRVTLTDLCVPKLRINSGIVADCSLKNIVFTNGVWKSCHVTSCDFENCLFEKYSFTSKSPCAIVQLTQLQGFL
jgi:hypothetical protein